MSEPREKALIRSDLAAESFVRESLRRFEHDFRELALLALADWERLGIVTPELFRSLASLQRPSWGHWNGLLGALREARKRVLHSGTAEQREQVRAATIVNAVLDRLDGEPPAELVADLRPLAQQTRSSVGRRPRLGALLALPITLRNDIAHFQPTDPAWWHDAAAALRPLADWVAANPMRPPAAGEQAFGTPWFLDGPSGGALNGVRDDAVIYALPSGEAVEAGAMVGPLHTALQRLFGREAFQKESLLKLLGRLAPDELKGVLLGDFLIRGPAVGRGGFAAVYAGTQVSTGRKVAVKVLHDGLGDDDRARFLQEGVLLSQFNHPNIVGVIGQGEGPWFSPRDPVVAAALAREDWFKEFTDSRPVKTFLALEWVEGLTLEQVYKGQRDGQPGLNELTGWFAQAAGALAAVHLAGLLHRDITPSNLMVTPPGEVKLMDFGIARQQDSARTIHTTPGRVLGTRAYLAPEQLETGTAAEAGPGADVYGLCATFYELYTGTRLFEHDQETEHAVTTRKQTEPRPRRPRSLRRELPWEIDTVLVGGLEREPADRYLSASDLERDLKRVLSDEPIAYRRPALWRRARLFYRRRRWPVNLVAGFLLLAVLGATGYIVSLRLEQARTLAQKQRADQQRDLAEARFEMAQDTVEEMLENVSELELYAVPLMEQTRQRLLEKALGFHEKLLQQKSDDPASRFLVARARRKVGEINRQLNRLDESRSSLELACAELEQLATELAAPAKYRQEWTTALLARSRVANQAGQLAEAEETARKALEVAETLSRDHPDEADYRIAVGGAQRALGLILIKTKRPREAEVSLRQALTLFESFGQTNTPVNLWLPQAEIHFDLCGLYRGQQNYRQALEAVHRGETLLQRVPLQEEQIKDRQTRANWRLLRDRRLAEFLLESAALHLSLGDLEAMETDIGRVVDIRQRLVRDFPTDPNNRFDLAMAYHGLSVLHVNRGRPQAERELLLALQQMEALTESFPEDNRYLRLHISLQRGVFHAVSLDLSRILETEQQLRGWLQVWQRRHKAAPTIPWHRLGIAECQFFLGKLLSENERGPEGMAFLKQSMETTAALVGTDRREREFRLHQAQLHVGVASVLRRANELEQAEKEARQGVSDWKQLADEQPDVTEWRSDYAEALVSLADVVAQRDRFDEAEQIYRQSLTIRDELNKAWPQVAQYQEQRGRTHSELADLHLKRNRLEESEKEYRIARDIFAQLCKDFPDYVVGQVSLCTAHHNLGWVKLKQEHLDEAAEAYGQAARIAADLDRQGRMPAGCVTFTPVNYTMVGLAQRDRKAYKEAETAFRHALTAWERIVSKTRKKEHRFELGRTHARLGDVLWRMEKPAEADPHLAAAIEELRKLVKENPQSQEYHDRLASVLDDRGALLGGFREDDAGPLFQDALSEYDWLVANDAKNTSYRDAQARTQCNLALWQAGHGKPTEAEHNHRQSLERWQKLAQLVPDQNSYRTQYAYQANNLGWFLESRKRPADAIPIYRLAEKAWRDQLARRPRDAEPRVELARLLTNLFACFNALNNRTEAIAALQNAIEQREVLSKQPFQLQDQRGYLGANLGTLAELFLDGNKPSEAGAVADRLVQLPEVKAEELLRAARVFARCASADNGRAGEWKQQAMTSLAQAVRKGWRMPAELEKSPDFTSLKDHPEFQKLLAELKKP
jgi:serine/threonine protein kinase